MNGKNHIKSCGQMLFRVTHYSLPGFIKEGYLQHT